MQNRYVKPQNVNDAMETIQKLFNQYRHAPLTKELLNYHTNLIQRLQSDIYREAIRENNPKQLASLNAMITAMQSWTQIRVQNKPFTGKMKNFVLTETQHPKFKQHAHKIKGAHNYHSARH